MEKKTIVIAAAGTGSRLEKYTRYFNKAMCTLGPKPVISYIIEKFTKKDEIIILLGYKGDLLKQVVKICYPDWNIKFVDVDKYEGEGSGPGYSLYCAKDLLQKPFIYWSNDTLIDEDVNVFNFSKNWILVGDPVKDSIKEYRHAEVDIEMNLKHVHEKNIFNDDGTYLPAIEICYIKDWQSFWFGVDLHKDEFCKIGVNAGLNYITTPVKAIKVGSWTDTGKAYLFEKYKESYNKKMEENILDKDDEFIWFIDDRVIKFHVDTEFISGRIERYQILKELLKGSRFTLPELISYDKNVYSYKKAEGVMIPKIMNPKLFKEFITEWFDNIPVVPDDKLAKDLYFKFFESKTLNRAIKCKEVHNIDDSQMIINGVDCIPAVDLIKKINWDEISKHAILSQRVHGDFHFDNVLYDEKNDKFVLLDWRQRFGGLTVGDVVYDLGKLYMAFVVSYEAAVRDMYRIEHLSDKEVIADIYCKFIYSKCKEVLDKFILEEFGEETLTHAQFTLILIMFGSSGCHPNGYGEFLFYMGKSLLNEFYSKHKEYFK